MNWYRDPASFRDPAGSIYNADGRIFRTVTKLGSSDYLFTSRSGLMARLVEQGFLIDSREVPVSLLPGVQAEHLIEHQPIPFISYPYEWCFEALKRAALLTLDLHLEALAQNGTLVDASAFNIQFLGTKPIFIDALSLRQYREGEPWRAQGQFVEQFLNPLILRAALGVAHNAWFRGTMTGIQSSALSAMLPWQWKMRWTVLANIVFPQLLQRRVGRLDSKFDCTKIAEARLSKSALVAILQQLRDFVAKLKAKNSAGIWSTYDKNNSYNQNEQNLRANAVARFAAQVKPKMLWDVGCNTGFFSFQALRNGAERAIGLDVDPDTVDVAFRNADENKFDFLPLVMDASNPSPSLGWRQKERGGIMQRRCADAILALAFVHHLAIAQNIPLDEIVDWLIDLAPHGIIEFIPLNDPTIKKMLVLRKNVVFSEYTEDKFVHHIEKRATIVERVPVTETGRVLYRYFRTS